MRTLSKLWGMICLLVLTMQMPKAGAQEGRISEEALKNFKAYHASRQGQGDTNTIRAIMLLPIYTNVPGNPKTKKEQQRKAQSLEAYRGATLAIQRIDSIGGKRLELHILDESTLTAKKLQLEIRKLKPHFVIESYYNQIAGLDTMVDSAKYYWIAPLANRAKVTNKCYFESMPDADNIQDTMVSWIASISDTMAGVEIVIMSENGSKDWQKVAGRLGGHKVRIIDYKGAFKKPFADDLELPRKTIVIIPSKNEAFVSLAIAHIKPIVQETIIVGLTQWQLFSSLNYETWERYRVVLPATYWVDYDNVNTLQVLSKYRAAFASEPSYYAWSAYDNIIKGYELATKTEVGGYIQGRYQYKATEAGGWKAKVPAMLMFRNYELKALPTPETEPAVGDEEIEKDSSDNNRR